MHPFWYFSAISLTRPSPFPLTSARWHQQCNVPTHSSVKNRRKEMERKCLPTQTSQEPPPCQKKKKVALLSAVFDLHVKILLKVVIRLSQRGACKEKKKKSRAHAQARMFWGDVSSIMSKLLAICCIFITFPTKLLAFIDFHQSAGHFKYCNTPPKKSLWSI